MSRLARALSALALGAIAVISAASARAEPSSSGSWRFQAASPVSAPPAVASSGNAYLASVEGVVHALSPDGRLRWSHGVAGMPLGEPALDRRERLYLTTSANRLYSFHADGRLRWRRPAGARIRSGAIWLESGRLLYLGGEQSLFATPSSGDALDSALVSADGLFVTAAGAAALAASARGAELWRWRGTARAQRRPLPSLPGAGDVQVLAADERVWLLRAGQLHALEPGHSAAVAWRVPARQAAVSADGETLLIETRTELRWLSARSGETVAHVPLSAAVSAAPAVANDGLALVPLVSGELLLASPGNAQLARVRVGAAPVLHPVWQEPAGRALVAAGDGALLSLQPRSGPSLAARGREPDAAVARSPESRGP